MSEATEVKPVNQLPTQQRLLEMMGEFHTRDELNIPAFFERVREWVAIPEEGGYSNELIGLNIVWFAAVIDKIYPSVIDEYGDDIAKFEAFIKDRLGNHAKYVRSGVLYQNSVKNWLCKFNWETALKIPLSYTLRDR
jgi:hypothetical protein